MQSTAVSVQLELYAYASTRLISDSISHAYGQFLLVCGITLQAYKADPFIGILARYAYSPVMHPYKSDRYACKSVVHRCSRFGQVCNGQCTCTIVCGRRAIVGRMVRDDERR